MAAEIVHVTATDKELLDEALRLSELRAQTYITPERKDKLTASMDHIFFELRARQDIVLMDSHERTHLSA